MASKNKLSKTTESYRKIKPVVTAIAATFGTAGALVGTLEIAMVIPLIAIGAGVLGYNLTNDEPEQEE